MKEEVGEEEVSEIGMGVCCVYTGMGSEGMMAICPSDVGRAKMGILKNDG
ncbi:hypothetical protein [Bacillus altitudinis]|nr:hypothetical protein [Bacillus altitudinis]